MNPRRHQMRRNEPLPAGVVRVDRATMWGNPFRADRIDAAEPARVVGSLGVGVGASEGVAAVSH